MILLWELGETMCKCHCHFYIDYNLFSMRQLLQNEQLLIDLSLAVLLAVRAHGRVRVILAT